LKEEDKYKEIDYKRKRERERGDEEWQKKKVKV
jgi:hypothetical protein